MLYAEQKQNNTFISLENAVNLKQNNPSWGHGQLCDKLFLFEGDKRGWGGGGREKIITVLVQEILCLLQLCLAVETQIFFLFSLSPAAVNPNRQTCERMTAWKTVFH